MPISLSKYLNLPSSHLESLGVLDPILDTDTRLFIDPHLLKHTITPEFKDSYEKLQKHFLGIGILLAKSTKEGDIFWRNADLRVRWPEVKGLCIGYSTKGTSGSGIGPALRKRILTTAQTIINLGKNDPEIFELVGLFENDFGSDRISDMTANIIKDDILNYTKKIYASMPPDTLKDTTLDKRTGIPLNPFTKPQTPILLIPKDILKNLPSAFEWTSNDDIGISNTETRESLNSLVGNTWKSLTTIKKESLKELILKYPDLIDDLIDQYTSKEPSRYDFEEDKSGEYSWYKATQTATAEHPLELTISNHPSIEEVEELVLKICGKFKDLTENNGLCNLFHDNKQIPKHESAIQLVFYGIAESYCDANKIMIARESNSGRGPVDFKFGSNKQNSVLVEVKKSNNKKLCPGIEKQLPEYMNSEGSKRAIYLVVDVGTSPAQLKRLNITAKKITGNGIKIFHVDGHPKLSASLL